MNSFAWNAKSGWTLNAEFRLAIKNVHEYRKCRSIRHHNSNVPRQRSTPAFPTIFITSNCSTRRCCQCVINFDFLAWLLSHRDWGLDFKRSVNNFFWLSNAHHIAKLATDSRNKNRCRMKSIGKGFLRTLFHGLSLFWETVSYKWTAWRRRTPSASFPSLSIMSLSLSLLGLVSFIYLYKLYKRLARTPLSDLPGPDSESFVAGEFCPLVLTSYPHLCR